MRKFLLQAVIVTSLMINLCLSRRLGIVGGTQSEIAGLPYQAAFLASGVLKCGACIVSEKCSLTAAHCTIKYYTNISLRVGSTIKDNGGQIVAVDEIVTHPQFDKVKLTYDFSMLILAEKINFNANVQPIALATEQPPDSTACVVSGWGLMDGDKKSKELRSVTVFIVNQTVCQTSYDTDKVKFRIVSSMMCAGVSKGGQDACSGDSGGPLACNGQLVGCVSSGYGCGLAEYPGIYGRISHVRSWILSTCGI